MSVASSFFLKSYFKATMDARSRTGQTHKTRDAIIQGRSRSEELRRPTRRPLEPVRSVKLQPAPAHTTSTSVDVVLILVLLLADDTISICGLVFSTFAFRSLANVEGTAWLKGVLIAQMTVLGVSLIYSVPEFIAWAFWRTHKAASGSLSCERHGNGSASASANVVFRRTLRSAASMLVFAGAGVMLGLTASYHIQFDQLQCGTSACNDARTDMRVVLWLNLARLGVKYSQSVLSQYWMAWQTECLATIPTYPSCA